MKMTDAIRKFRLQNPSTKEDLQMHWGNVLSFGDRILLAGHWYSGKGKPCWFGAVYEYLDDDDHSIEGMIGLREVSDVQFEDEGHAIRWAMDNS